MRDFKYSGWCCIYNWSFRHKTNIPVKCNSLIYCNNRVTIVGGINDGKIVENSSGGSIMARPPSLSEEDLMELYKKFDLELEPKISQPTPQEMEDFFNDA